MCFSSNEDFIGRLVNSCKGIEDYWQQHLDFWEDDERGDYNDIGVVVHFVIDGFIESQTDGFEKTFNLVENAVKCEVADVAELAIVGFIEGLLFVGSHKGINSNFLRQWMGQESFESLKELEKFFGSST